MYRVLSLEILYWVLLLINAVTHGEITAITATIAKIHWSKFIINITSLSNWYFNTGEHCNSIIKRDYLILNT